ncbi:MAG: N-acetylmuramoyl-L-alanine amidase [Phenylobacterium zucineum]|nr:MAG: N-acetylmuramoyl-L-alanine amidase [Phenylobacterium zucineum]
MQKFALLRRKSAVFVAGLIGCLAFISTSRALAGRLLTVRLGGDSLETRLVIDLDRSVSGKVEGSESTDHTVILTLPGVESVNVTQGSGQGLVRAWSVSRSPFGAKLKIELVSSASVKRRFVLPPADGVENYRYVLDLAVAKSEAEPAESRGRTGMSRPRGLRLASLSAARRDPAYAFKKTVVIDAGHGGRDPGARGAEGAEKDVTLASARALKARLERSGKYIVVMTRDTDRYVPLETRVQIARQADADLFISLHADSGPDASTRGASVYTLADRAASRSARLVSKDDWFMKASLQGDRGVSGILFDLTQRATKNRSATFAELLLERLSENQTLLRRSHREAGLAVLLAPDVPAVLLEMGFITSPDDEAVLMDSKGREKLTGAVADAIEAYFAHETRLASR